MVNFIYGRANVDKTDALISAAKAYSGAGMPVYMVVPEQLSMQREFVINDMHLNNVKVCSFSRLTNEIFRALGGTAKKSPDDVMTAAAVYRAAINTYDRLTYYKSVALSSGFISKLVSVFSEFDMNRITAKAVMSVPESETTQSFRNKYSDLFLIYNEYKKMWQDEYKALGDDIITAAGLVELLPFFENTAVIFDGFYGFTPAQLTLIEQIIIKADSCVFCFTTDLESEVFSTVTAELEKIHRICKKNSVDVSFEKLTSPLRLNTLSQQYLEKYAFGLTARPAENIEFDGLTLYSAKNFNEELGFIACKIKNDVLSGKYRYKDIAVLVPPAEDIATVVAAVFEKHNVPVFIDLKRTLLSKPLTAFVIHALEIVIEGFEFENVFAFLKTGLTGIAFDDISMLESYVRMWKIRPSGWSSEWTRNPAGLAPEIKPQDAARLEKLNSLRIRITEPLNDFRCALRGNCRDMLVAVCKLFDAFDVRTALAQTALVFENTDNPQAADEYTRIYDIFADMLDSIDCVFGTDNISVRRFYDLITVCASSVCVTHRPTRIDEVIFAPIGSARADFAKCVYIPNMVSGVFPSPLSDRSLITESDKRLFNKYGISASMDFITFSQRENFDLYIAAFSATDELILSYSQFEITGEPRRPSRFIEDIKKITGISELQNTDLPLDFHLVSVSAASELAASGIYPDIASVIYDITGLKPLALRKEDDCLTDSIVEGMYSKNLRLSFSGIEEYVGCPFKFFMHRGLRIGKNDPVEFDPANVGTFIHKGLERLLCDYDISDTDEDGVRSIVGKIADDYYNTELKDCKNRSKRFDYLFSRARYALENAAVNVASEVKSSAFVPYDFEINISDHIPPVLLQKGYTLSLTGSIDRVDVADTDNGRFAKVVDYKSAAKKFSLEKIYNGFSMQLPIYAGAVRAKHGDIKLAAMYYLKVGVPKIELKGTGGCTDEQFRELMDRSYVRDGIFLSSPDIIQKMDPTGSFIKKLDSNNLIDENGINLLMDFTLDKIHDIGQNITNGDIRVSPVCHGDTDSCKYCDYKDICKISGTPEKVRGFEPLPEDFLKKESD